MELKIGEVAKRGGVNLQTIRYYEREGLLPQPPRLASGYRVFPPETVRRVRFIKRAQEVGFTLTEIQELLSLRLDGRRSPSTVCRLAAAKITEIEEKIRLLESMKRVLLKLTKPSKGSRRTSKGSILESIEGAL